MKTATLTILFVAMVTTAGRAQNLTGSMLWQRLAGLDQRNDLRPAEKLGILYGWKKEADASAIPHDSAYAKLLHRLGAMEFNLNNNFSRAIGFTSAALAINCSRMPGSSTGQAPADCYNLAFFYDNFDLLHKALLFYDSAINLVGKGPDDDDIIPDSKLQQTNIYFRMGDYEKAIDLSDLWIQWSIERKDAVHYLAFLNQRAQARFFLNQLSGALADMETALSLANSLHRSFDIATAYKTRGLILAKQRAFREADASFKRCIAERVKSGFFGQVAGDYNDLGIIFSDSLHSYTRAIATYSTGLDYAKKAGDSIRLARITLNLSQCYLAAGQTEKAMTYCQKSMRYLGLGKNADLLSHPTTEQLAPIGNRELLQSLFNGRTELLLSLYKQKKEMKWLTACLQAALLSDSLITLVRHEQMGDQSKLYWRGITRSLYRDALEAAFFAHDNQLAFYFMEKSRSVMLQDKLNELGASAILPATASARQDSLRNSIIECRQHMLSVPETAVQYQQYYLQLARAKENLESFIHSLEKKYPAYYQYKYGGDVPSLTSLQEYLRATRQQFIDYFINDTASFALFVTPTEISLRKISDTALDPEPLLDQFSRQCSSENYLNSSYPAFLGLANRLYQVMIAPFKPGKGRIVICQDNHLIPFEALCSDKNTGRYLIEDYSFSYVYSARYLLGSPVQPEGHGNFLGMAPVEFNHYKRLASLTLSGIAVGQCANYYAHAKVLTGSTASHRRFLDEVPGYHVVTVFTHAAADSTDAEPLLFMSDSALHLSELQLLEKPSTRLILLSACVTNVGRSYSGEGIFSLARGFSGAGIPSVAATLWESDEQSIYTLSSRFNEYISKGMNKDDALREAKLFFIGQDRNKNALPVYWAPMILIGNADPVPMIRRATPNWAITLVIAVLTLLAVLIVFRQLRRWSAR